MPNRRHSMLHVLITVIVLLTLVPTAETSLAGGVSIDASDAGTDVGIGAGIATGIGADVEWVQRMEASPGRSLVINPAELRGKPVTVVAKFHLTHDYDSARAGDLLSVDLITDPDATGSALSISWGTTTVGWFSMMGLELTSDMGLLGERYDVSVRPGGEQFYELAVTSPAAGHQYEAVLSYDPVTGWLSTAVNDLTTGTRVGATERPVQSIDNPIYVRVSVADTSHIGVQSVEVIDPHGRTWDLGAEDMTVIVGNIDVQFGPFEIREDTVEGIVTVVADRPLDSVPFTVRVVAGTDGEDGVWTTTFHEALSPEPVHLVYRFPNPGTDRYVPIDLRAEFDGPVVSRVEGNGDREVITAAWRQRMEGLVPVSHPRLFATAENLDLFRAYADDPWWETMLKPQADALLNQPLPEEPPSGPASRVNTAEGAARWRAAYSAAGNAGGAAQTLAFAYLVTGDVTYASQAKAIALEMATWDAQRGSTSLENDEAFIRVIHMLPFVYTWIYDVLSDDERATLEQAIALRGRLLYRHLTRRPMLQEDVLDSHRIRFVPTLGLAGLALYHELDEAQEWVAWANAYYSIVFPPWGSDAGGWSEGLGYWAQGVLNHIEYLDAWYELGVDDLYEISFFKNTGYFGRYMLAPHLSSSFGDLSSGKIALSTNVVWLMNRLAHVHDDPYLYVRPWRELSPVKTYYNSSVYPSHVHAVLQRDSELTPAPVEDLPAARLFEDIGWVAMHSHLGSVTDNIMLTFKSSPFGSISHSHADQNSFILDAFGEPLFISAGYREWHGSPHHTQWTQQTKSKNAILMGGLGQVTGGRDHAGDITQFYAGERFSLASGQAAGAYPSGVNSWLRTFVFVNNEYFIVHDYVSTNRARLYQWLLHSDHRMHLDDAHNRMTVTAGNAGAFAQIVHPEAGRLRLSQTDVSDPPVDPEYETRFPNQWHVLAETVEPSSVQNFVTLLYPFRLGDGADRGTDPGVDSKSLDNGTAIVIKHEERSDLALVAWGDEGESQSLDVYDLEMTGRLAVIVGWEDGTGALERWFLQGESLMLNGHLLWQAESSGEVERMKTSEIIANRHVFLLRANMANAGEVAMNVDRAPQVVAVNGERYADETWRYDDGLLHLRLPEGLSYLYVRQTNE